MDEPVARERQPERMSLAEFVEENSKLITGFVAFIGLTTFLLQQDDPEIKSTLPGLTLLAAFLILIEIIVRGTFRPRSWRLELFQLLVMGLMPGMAWYWLKTFIGLWLPLLGFVLTGVVVLVPVFLLTIAVIKFLEFPAPLMLPRGVEDEQRMRRRVGWICFYLFTLVITGAMMWFGHKLPKPIK